MEFATEHLVALLLSASTVVVKYDLLENASAIRAVLV